MDDLKGLCERLDGWVRRDPVESPYELMREAATALSTLSRELAEARAERDEARKQASALQLDAVSELMRANAAEAASASKDERIMELSEVLRDVIATGLNGGNNVRLAFLTAGGKELSDDLLAKAQASEDAVARARAILAKEST